MGLLAGVSITNKAAVIILTYVCVKIVAHSLMGKYLKLLACRSVFKKETTIHFPNMIVLCSDFYILSV